MYVPSSKILFSSAAKNNWIVIFIYSNFLKFNNNNPLFLNLNRFFSTIEFSKALTSNTLIENN